MSTLSQARDSDHLAITQSLYALLSSVFSLIPTPSLGPTIHEKFPLHFSSPGFTLRQLLVYTIRPPNIHFPHPSMYMSIEKQRR